MTPTLDSIFNATDSFMTLDKHHIILYLGSGDPVSTLNAFLLPLYLVTKMGRLSLKCEYVTVRLALKTVPSHTSNISQRDRSMRLSIY